MLQQFLTLRIALVLLTHGKAQWYCTSINQTLLLSPFSELHYSLGLIKLASTVPTS